MPSPNATFTTVLTLALVLASLAGCRSGASANQGADEKPAAGPTSSPTSSPASAPAAAGTRLATPPGDGLATAIVAGGCFWCMEKPFESQKGVKEVLSGYTGGPERHPTYQQVASKQTGHTEAVWIIYDPKVISYEQLIEVYWRTLDPTDGGGQFYDRGKSYRPVIFYGNDQEKAIAERSKKALDASGRFDKPIAVAIEPAQDFWIAEDYHQNYYKTNPAHYKRYSAGSGREAFIKEHWGDQAH